MKLKDAAKAITQYHEFYITPEYWKRIGVICSRYTADAVCEAITEMKKEKYDSLDHLLNGVEIRCQDKSAKSVNDDFFNEITKE